MPIYESRQASGSLLRRVARAIQQIRVGPVELPEQVEIR